MSPLIIFFSLDNFFLPFILPRVNEWRCFVTRTTVQVQTQADNLYRLCPQCRFWAWNFLWFHDMKHVFSGDHKIFMNFIVNPFMKRKPPLDLPCQRHKGWNKIWPPLQLVLGLTLWLGCERTCLPMQETQEMWVWSLGWEDPLKKKMETCSSILAWKFHGQSSLLAYSPCGHKESGMTKQAHTHTHTYMHTISTLKLELIQDTHFRLSL